MAARKPAGTKGGRDEPLVNLNARVPRELWRRVRVQCVGENRLLRAWVTDALESYLAAKRR